MIERNVSLTEPAEGDALQVGAGVSRRRLIRAGLSAAPVVAALKSNTVLAGTGGYCVRPSAFASIKGALVKGQVPSRYKTGNDEHKKFCKHPSEWANTTCAGYANHRFHYVAGQNCLSFAKSPSNFGNTRKTSDVLQYHNASLCPAGVSAVNGKLASYLTSCFLTASQYGDENCYLTKNECRAIWSSGGSWQPAPKVSWNSAQTLEYLDYLMANGCKS